jgi:pentatricopeptide repeat protein
MEEKAIPPNTHVLNHLLTAYARAGKVDAALALLPEMGGPKWPMARPDTVRVCVFSPPKKWWWWFEGFRVVGVFVMFVCLFVCLFVLVGGWLGARRLADEGNGWHHPPHTHTHTHTQTYI